MLLDVQYSSATNDWPTLRDAVLRAEADGYDTTWVFDHFDGDMLGGTRSVLECCTLLGALAAITSTINVGTLVANVANRHPAVLAAGAASAHEISGGRVRIGIGAGTAPGTRWAAEHERRGIALHPKRADRHQAVVGQIAALRAVTAAPVIIGVNTVALAAIAGQLADGVNIRLEHVDADDVVAAARAAAADRPFEVSAYTLASAAEAAERCEQLGIQRLVLTRLGAIDPGQR